ncbi:hypothetical protein FRB94_012535 [Tulasnella sp. JGI-2019a]|nr:hypothetical protein FRB94_012535 [Tulasnella sp. JGI-2019a]KAG9015371.1 hypothetical protein FRB93_013071 [Tulasnella sp. JGI-2019a]KAG9023817.1 hypothetical protein FRB95_012462 [Tulasnella sp. JGI-2019a]
MVFLTSHLPRCLAVLATLASTTLAHPITNRAPAIVRLPTPQNATYAVGSQVFKLVDDSRTDPFNSTVKRAVEITVYYPSSGQNDGTCPGGTSPALYMPTVMAGLADQGLGIPSGTLESILTDTCLGASAVSSDQRNLIVMSPALGISRLVYQTYTTALAAHGYVVVGIDHPYDAELVEYPDGQLVFAVPINGSDPAAVTSRVEIRTKDVQFVLDQVCSNKNLTAGIPVDCGARKVGMFGHAVGGATTADMTIIDQRIAGGINIDGTFYPTQSGPDVSPDTHFLVIAEEGHNAMTDPTYADWFKTPTANSSERFIATVKGAKQATFTDYPVLVDLLGITPSSLPADEAAALGTIDGNRISVIIQISFNAWFDLILQGQTAAADALLKNGFPEVDIVQLA